MLVSETGAKRLSWRQKFCKLELVKMLDSYKRIELKYDWKMQRRRKNEQYSERSGDVDELFKYTASR